ncbi:MAG: ABC transporter permease [Planctomycetes bacterium]|nr:ABC transporter permease [Planctomycetota bacterium]
MSEATSDRKPRFAAVRRVGAQVDEILCSAGFSVALLFRTAAALRYLPRRRRFFLDAAHAAGVKSLPVSLVVALFAGMILALQTGIELRRLGQSDLIGSILALSMCREMGPFMTGIILAATVGSAIAAEVGTMKVSDEVTALDVMSIDAANYIVLPRVAAMTLMCPAVTVVTDLVGIAGGAVVSHFHLGITQQTYWLAARESLTSTTSILPKDVYVGLVKAIVFGCTIATVSCAAGLRAGGGALGVGRAVQRAVMSSIILIIVLGYAITWLFYFLLPE